MPSLSLNDFIHPGGRLSRTAFWFGAAILVVAGTLLSVVPVVGVGVGFLLLWPWYSLMAQRLHDTGRSGGVAVLPLIPMALASVLSLAATLAVSTGPAAAALLPLLAASGLIVLIAALAALVFVVWIGLMPGQSSPNDWGPVPGRR